MSPRLYDLLLAPLERLGLARLRTRIFGRTSGTVLEIGAGTGLNLPRHGRGARVVATDPDEAKLRRARDRRPRAAGWVVCDGERLPFREAAFDAVAVALALCTIPHPDRALAEARRVLGPGGELRALEHVRLANPVLGGLQDLATPVWRRIAEGCHLNRDAARLVEEAGFVVERREAWLGGLLVGIVARRPLTRES